MWLALTALKVDYRAAPCVIDAQQELMEPEVVHLLCLLVCLVKQADTVPAQVLPTHLVACRVQQASIPPPWVLRV